jgi:hypothetical protein
VQVKFKRRKENEFEGESLQGAGFWGNFSRETCFGGKNFALSCVAMYVDGFAVSRFKGSPFKFFLFDGLSKP